MSDQTKPLLAQHQQQQKKKGFRNQVTVSGSRYEQIEEKRRWITSKNVFHDLGQLAQFLKITAFNDNRDPNMDPKQGIVLWETDRELAALIQKINNSDLPQQLRKQIGQKYQKYVQIHSQKIPPETMAQVATIGWVLMNDEQQTIYTRDDSFRRSQIMVAKIIDLFKIYPSLAYLSDKKNGMIFSRVITKENTYIHDGAGAFIIRIYLWWWWNTNKNMGVQQSKQSSPRGGAAIQKTPLSPLFIRDGTSSIIYTTRCRIDMDNLEPLLMDLGAPNDDLVPEQFNVDDNGATQYWKVTISPNTNYVANKEAAWYLITQNDMVWWQYHKKFVYRILADLDVHIDGGERSVRIVNRLPPSELSRGKKPAIRGQDLTIDKPQQQHQGGSQQQKQYAYRDLTTRTIRRAVSDINKEQANKSQKTRRQMIDYLKNNLTLAKFMDQMGYDDPYVFFHGTPDEKGIINLLREGPKQQFTKNKIFGEGFYVSPNPDTALWYAVNRPKSQTTEDRYMISYLMTRPDADKLKYGVDFNTNLKNTLEEPSDIIALRDSASKFLVPFLVSRI